MDYLDNEKNYTSSEVVNLVGISLRQLYYWELKGVVQPQTYTLGSREFKRFTEADVKKLKEIKKYLEDGYSLVKAFEKVKNI